MPVVVYISKCQLTTMAGSKLVLGKVSVTLAQYHCAVRRYLYVKLAVSGKVCKTFVLHRYIRCKKELSFISA